MDVVVGSTFQVDVPSLGCEIPAYNFVEDRFLLLDGTTDAGYRRDSTGGWIFRYYILGVGVGGSLAGVKGVSRVVGAGEKG